MKSFKYFDLNNSGAVEPDEFAKAIEKIGIMIPTKQVSKASVRDTFVFSCVCLVPSARISYYYNLNLIKVIV